MNYLRNSGAKNPFNAMRVYDALIDPLRKEAREDRLKELFKISADPNSSEEDRTQARTMLAAELGKEDLVNDLAWKDKQR